MAVVVQRDPRYWQWFLKTSAALFGALSSLLFAVGDAHVLPENWSTLCLRASFVFGTLLGIHFGSTAQPPRVRATYEQLEAIREAIARDNEGTGALPVERTP